VGAAVNSSDSVSHGTACAAIALGANNSECSVGIAPGATLAGCPMLGRIGHGFVPGVPYHIRHVLSYGTDVNDVSSNSWGVDACSSLQSRRALQSSGGACPFNASLAGSPCLAAACLTSASEPVWAQHLEP
jgi:subtilisin family serine protease